LAIAQQKSLKNDLENCVCFCPDCSANSKPFGPDHRFRNFSWIWILQTSLEYDGFELGIMGEARIAYEIIPRLHIGANARYFKSDVDMKGYTSSEASSSIDQFSATTYWALSANWRLGR